MDKMITEMIKEVLDYWTHNIGWYSKEEQISYAIGYVDAIQETIDKIRCCEEITLSNETESIIASFDVLWGRVAKFDYNSDKCFRMIKEFQRKIEV